MYKESLISVKILMKLFDLKPTPKKEWITRSAVIFVGEQGST